MKKPEPYTIPSRGSLDIEPEVQLTDEEQRAKERRILEIKKMIAIQSLQTDDSNLVSSPYNNSSYYKKAAASARDNYHLIEANLDKEKRAREQVDPLKSVFFFLFSGVPVFVPVTLGVLCC